MNAPERFFLPDIQASADHRQQAIDKVGVKGLRYPLALFDAQGQVQHSVAEVNMAVGLPPEVKGTHMSRFIELLEKKRPALTPERLLRMLDEMLRRLDADSGKIELAFPYFVSKEAPISGVESLLDYDVRLRAEKRPGRAAELHMEVVAPVTSLCPCSKKISDYGAHNQRSHITLAARLREPMTPDALLRLAEEEASCEVYGLLKRPDEKWVTERAYDNPKFVEDLAACRAFPVSATGVHCVQGKARRRGQWSFHGKPPQRRHARNAPPSRRVACQSGVCGVAALARRMTAGGAPRLASIRFGRQRISRGKPDRLLVRDIALRLKRESRIAAWTVKSENFESIHNHSAYAEISGTNGEDKQ